MNKYIGQISGREDIGGEAAGRYHQSMACSSAVASELAMEVEKRNEWAHSRGKWIKIKLKKNRRGIEDACS